MLCIKETEIFRGKLNNIQRKYSSQFFYECQDLYNCSMNWADPFPFTSLFPMF